MLAADFSITQLRHQALHRLLRVLTRSSCKRPAVLRQFIMHSGGLIIFTMQAMFSSFCYFMSVPLYQGFLMVGHVTIYTMFPVFLLVLVQGVNPYMAMLYLELYKDLAKGISISFKTFFIWVLISTSKAASSCTGPWCSLSLSLSTSWPSYSQPSSSPSC